MDRETLKKEITRIYKTSGKFPKIAELSVMVQQPTYKVTEILRDFVKEGFLVRVGNWYRFPAQQEIMKPEPKIIIPIEPERHKPPRAHVSKVTTQTIRWSLGLVGLGMVLISSYYTEVWMVNYVPEVLAWLFAILIVGFSVMAFETAIYFHGQQMKGVSFAFFFLWVVVVLFSVGSTVAGQYNKIIKDQATETQRNEITTGNTLFYNLKDADRIRLQSIIAKKQTRQGQVLELLAPYDNQPQDDAYTKLQAEYNRIERDIKSLSDEYKVVLNDIQKLVKDDPALLSKRETPNFFNWLATVFHTDAKTIQFWMYLMPAVLIDLLAPIGIAVFLFLGGRSYNRAEEKQ